MADILLEFRRNGVMCGFAASEEKEFIFKRDKYTSVMLPTETLKRNLREMVRSRKAKIIKAGTVEAVAVPLELFKQLFI